MSGQKNRPSTENEICNPKSISHTFSRSQVKAKVKNHLQFLFGDNWHDCGEDVTSFDVRFLGTVFFRVINGYFSIIFYQVLLYMVSF